MLEISDDLFSSPARAREDVRRYLGEAKKPGPMRPATVAALADLECVAGIRDLRTLAHHRELTVSSPARRWPIPARVTWARSGRSGIVPSVAILDKPGAVETALRACDPSGFKPSRARLDKPGAIETFIAALRRGLGARDAAATVGLTRQSVSAYARKHPEFATACRIARSLAMSNRPATRAAE